MNLTLFLIIIHSLVYIPILISYAFKNSRYSDYIIIPFLIFVFLIIIARFWHSEDVKKTVEKRTDFKTRMRFLIILIILVLLFLTNRTTRGLAFFLGLPLFWEIVIRGHSFSIFGFTKHHLLKAILNGILVIILEVPIFYYFLKIRFDITGIDLIRPGSFAEMILNYSPSLKFLLFGLYSFFIVSLGEEIFFRGFIQRNLENLLKKPFGSMLSVLIYTAPHLLFFMFWPINISILFVTSVFFIGSILTILYSEGRNIVSTLIAHGLLVSFIGGAIKIF